MAYKRVISDEDGSLEPQGKKFDLRLQFTKSKLQYYELKPFSGNSYKGILGSLDFSHSDISFVKALFLIMVYRNIGGGGVLDHIWVLQNKKTLKQHEIIISC